MKFLSPLVAMLFLQPLHALETDPNKMKILQCMAVYEFDFVAEELGFSVAQVGEDGKEEEPLSDRAAEKRQIIAEAIIEAMALKGHLEGLNEKSSPAPLEHSF
jgi:hypothetical protein